MPDTPAPTPTPEPDPKKRRRAQGPINQALVDELNLAEELAANAAKPDYSGPLAEEDLDAAFLASLVAEIGKADALIGAATGKTADKKAASRDEDDSEQALLALIQKVQTRAKRKYPKTSDPMRGKYFIGERIDSNRGLLERATRAILATLNGDPAQGLAADTLPGQKPEHTAALQAALDAYVQSQTEQTGGQANASDARTALEAQVKVVAGLRRDLQYAVDAAWPARDKANAPTRKLFALPPDKALK